MGTVVEHSAKDSRIAVRMTAEDEVVIRAAAAATGATITDFTVGAAVARARDILSDHRVFVLDDSAWTEFQDILDQPVRRDPALERLLTRRSVFSDEDQ
jgi:uncharacterized protein (DUF1778 family)